MKLTTTKPGKFCVAIRGADSIIIRDVIITEEDKIGDNQYEKEVHHLNLKKDTSDKDKDTLWVE